MGLSSSFLAKPHLRLLLPSVSAQLGQSNDRIMWSENQLSGAATSIGVGVNPSRNLNFMLASRTGMHGTMVGYGCDKYHT